MHACFFIRISVVHKKKVEKKQNKIEKAFFRKKEKAIHHDIHLLYELLQNIGKKSMKSNIVYRMDIV